MLYFMVAWLSASIVILATGWYAAAVFKQFWPEWWQQVVVEMDPNFEANDNSFAARSSGQRNTTRPILK